MKPTTPFAVRALASGALALGMGCAHPASTSSAGTAAFEGPTARVVELPVPPTAGPNRQANVVVDEPSLRLATITLRAGTTLPEHRSPRVVTIQALAGSGAVIVDGARYPVDAAHAVVLAPNAPHSVQPDDDEALVLLVHHAGLAPEGGQ